MKPIQVWPFADAPPGLQALSHHGGDEDWLAVVPAEYARLLWISWLEGRDFGSCDTSEHRLDDGSVVYIGAHA